MKYFLMICAVVLRVTPTFAADRNLPGIEIITREEWGADETWRYADSSHFDRWYRQTEQYELWLDGKAADPTGDLAARKLRNEKREWRRERLRTYDAFEIDTDKYIETESGHDLLRPIGIKEKKTKIIIHHTAGSQTYPTPQAALEGVQEIYKYHTVNRAWGDVGYNFLIDPFGNIYEGRAGGAGAVGAHADWNNVTTIGIALMGNFDLYEPTPEMRAALKKLTSVLAWQYDIIPNESQPYFTAIEEDPWLIVHEHDSIVGHSDTKNTACPGEYVYAKLPELKNAVMAYQQMFASKGFSSSDQVTSLQADRSYHFEGNLGTVEVDMTPGTNLQCGSLHDHVEVMNCERGDDGLEIGLRRLAYPASGVVPIFVEVGTKGYLVDAHIVWDDDLTKMHASKRNLYIATNGLPAAASERKMKDRIDLNAVKPLLDDKIHVLLYDLTVEFDNWDMRCESACDVILDDQVIQDATIVNVVEDKDNDTLNVFVDLKKYTSSKVVVKNKSLIVLTNYNRSYAGYPMNSFRGDITIRKDDYNHLDLGWISRYVIINSVGLDDYLLGMGEIDERQHIEKLKTMALLIKNYALFYIAGSNPHASLPEDGSYTAVDDPRIFQKYLGAGFEAYGHHWKKALQATEDEIITYDGILPILPYFHCSAGFTWDGKEYFGWTDTPWLQSVLDVTSCRAGKFEGHGVGLSGDGAEKMAQKGATYKQILEYYYQGIEIERLK